MLKLSIMPSAIILGFIVILIIPNAAHAGYASIVVDADTEKVLRSRNADTRNYPASLVKIMTLYMTFEALESGRFDMKTRLKVSKRAAGQPPSILGLKRGQSITVREAIMALVTKSANDAATVLAEALGGTEWKFAQLMTRKAKKLGMKRTLFMNASGLPNSKQLSTARDMAILALSLMRNFPEHYHFFSLQSFNYKGRKYKNHNNLLGVYSGVDGVKTGYTRSSGFNLVASAERGGRRVIAVVFGGKTSKRRDRHMAGLLDIGFSRLAPIKRSKNRYQFSSIPNPSPSSPNKNYLPLPNDPRTIVKSKTIHQAKTSDNWAIQVGAYSRLHSASITIQRANSIAKKFLKSSFAEVSSTKTKTGNTLYRARFLGLDLSLARKACLALKESGIPCIVFNPSDL